MSEYFMEEISLKAENLFKIGEYVVTNSIFLSFFVSIFLIAGALFLKKQIKMIPGKIQSGAEMIIEALLELMDSVLGSREKTERYFPLIATIFIFVFASNIFGIIPGVGSLTFHEHGKEVPLFRSPASDLNFTLAIAIISVFLANIFGAMAVGFSAHFSKFFNFKNPISFFIGTLELVSELAKVISLSFRLFGNVFAGEVLLTIIFFLAPYFIPLPFLFMELFVGFIQAFVFAMLTLVSVALHTEEHAH